MSASWEFLSAMLAIVEDGRGGFDVRTWFGPTPSGEPEIRPYAVARMIGYEASAERGALRELTSAEAVGALAFFASDTIVMPAKTAPSEKLLRPLERYIARLGVDARFYSNGRWHDYVRTNPFSWHSLSEATFDGGVIGMNDEVAFIFWVEEED